MEASIILKELNKEALIKALSKYKLNVITTEMNYNEQPVEKTR